MAIQAYNSPGVTVSETVNPSLAPLLANPSVVAVVADAQGYQTASERLILSGTTAQNFANEGIDTTSVVVTLATTGETLNAGNYTVDLVTNPDGVVGSGDETYSIARVAQPSTAIVAAAGTGTLTGTYQYACSFVNSKGETGIGTSASNTLTLAAQGGSLSSIPLGPTGTTARNIYRLKTTASGGDGLWHLVATINDNTGTVLTDETTSDATAQAATQAKTGIADGDTVVAAYNFTDLNYYLPTNFDDFNDLTDKYGPAYDSNGNISSNLTFAARLVFLNGASEVVCVAAKSSASADYDSAFAQLESETEVNIVVVGNGTSQVHSSAAAHVNKMIGQGYYRFCVLGRDGSTTAIDKATLRSAAQGFNNEAVQLVSPASFQTQNPVTGRSMNVGAQWVAAALAGMYAARDVQIPLTRKSVAGFSDINDKRTASDLALDSAAGLEVIENKGGVLRVRHGITTAVGAVQTREASVVRAKYEMATRLKNTLDAGVVGVVLSQDQAPLTVQAAVTGVLEQLVIEGAIEGYSGVTGRIKAGDPTTVEVKFSYNPAYPINNINVIFTIDTTTGDTTLA